MCLNQFKGGEALPLRQRRIFEPPNVRRRAGGIDAASPSATRRTASVTSKNIQGMYSPTLPDNFPAISGKLFKHYPTLDAAEPRTSRSHYWRPFVGMVAACCRQFPVSRTVYVRH
jgi:hypothetical protein